jgi:predicted RNA-binding Zn-ribbon protein involved in translation (DUF1610 family)
MGVPLEFWVETMKKHPALWRFKGLGSRRGGKDSFHKDVREACVEDEEFMSDYMEKEAKYRLEQLKELLEHGDKGATGPDEDEWEIESYASFLRCQRWNYWDEPENINHAPARKVIEKLEPAEGVRVSIDNWGGCTGPDDVRHAWAYESSEPSEAWDTIRRGEPEYYLKEHPPVEMWSHAYEQGVPLDEVIFVCPGCGSEPIQQKNVDGAHYYCGLCGAEACPDEGQTLESWAADMSVKLWPFKSKEEEKKTG